MMGRLRHRLRNTMLSAQSQANRLNSAASTSANPDIQVALAKMNDALPSPEFVFPILAAWKINPAETKPRIASALESVRQVGSKSNPALMYVEGILLRMSGQEQEAAKLLQEAVKTSQDVFLTYLAQVGLREMFGR